LTQKGQLIITNLEIEMTAKSVTELLDNLKNIEDQTESNDKEEVIVKALRKQKNLKPKVKKALLDLYDAGLVKTEYENETRDSRRESFLSAMLEEPSRKLLVEVNRNTFRKLKSLAKKFPNFSHVISRYVKSLHLQTLGETATVWLPPILLLGPPGVGKTRFIIELAEVLGTCFFSVDMSTTSAGFVLSGSSATWSNGAPGFVTESLRKSKVANPMMLVDEIDKASIDARSDPLACFYSLLEQHTAKEFKDECLKIPMDCSGINWVASANNIDRIAAPILSRMEVIEILPPTAEQVPVIVQSVFSEMLQSNEWGARFTQKLSEQVLNVMMVCTPREMGKVLEKSCANAAQRKGSSQGKIRVEVHDVELPNEMSTRRIGF